MEPCYIIIIINKKDNTYFSDKRITDYWKSKIPLLNEEIFSYKYFKGRNALSESREYIKVLEKKGFNKTKDMGIVF